MSLFVQGNDEGKGRAGYIQSDDGMPTPGN